MGKRLKSLVLLFLRVRICVKAKLSGALEGGMFKGRADWIGWVSVVRAPQVVQH